VEAIFRIRAQIARAMLSYEDCRAPIRQTDSVCGLKSLPESGFIEAALDYIEA
jgi:hypothetical protein